MSTRCSLIYGRYIGPDDKEHSFHIYQEAFSDEYYVVDDCNRNPQRLKPKVVKELMAAYRRAQKGTRDG